MKFEPFPDNYSGEIDAKLELDYPCHWTYTLIGREEESLRAAAHAVLGGREHSFEFSHASKQGKYLSFHVGVTVVSDHDRVRVGTLFNEHPDIKFVL